MQGIVSCLTPCHGSVVVVQVEILRQFLETVSGHHVHDPTNPKEVIR